MAWAAGKGGPDFFIDMYRRRADWWNNEHTVWGEITEKESLHIVDGMFELPTEKRGLTYLKDSVEFEISGIYES